jgi:hypothetical protein
MTKRAQEEHIAGRGRETRGWEMVFRPQDIPIRDSGEFKNKLMGVVVYFSPAEKINNQVRGSYRLQNNKYSITNNELHR